jgi:hypothetical protein
VDHRAAEENVEASAVLETASGQNQPVYAWRSSGDSKPLVLVLAPISAIASTFNF